MSSLNLSAAKALVVKKTFSTSLYFFKAGLIALFSVLIVTGCKSPPPPQPVIDNRVSYVLPSDEQGKVCADRCPTLHTDCRNKQSQCILEAQYNAQPSYQEALRNYGHNKRMIGHQIMNCNERNRQADMVNDQIMTQYYSSFNKLPPGSPPPPHPVTQRKEDCPTDNNTEPQLSQFTNDGHCERNCQFEADRCFENCGGTIRRETKCIANCNPPEKK